MNSPPRILVGSGALILAGGLLLAPGIGLAHTPTATPSCDGLSLTMSSYPGPGTPNRLTVTIDGSVALDTTFGESFNQLLPWSSSNEHHWIVVVDGLTNDGDATFTGTQPACQAETSTTAVSGESTTTTSAGGGETTTTRVGGTGGELTTTTLVGSAGGSLAPTTTTTTTTAVASRGPLPRLSPAGGALGSGGVLPRTGSDMTLRATMIAAGLLVAGMVLTMAAARRRAAFSRHH